MNQQRLAPEKSCDVLIVGAGVSGLFAAWRLLQRTPHLKVIVVDKLGRVGGRLQTTQVQIRGVDGELSPVKDEQGGMRFVPKGNGMGNLWALLDRLEIATVPFMMGAGNNRMFARGVSFTRAQASGMWSSLYRLLPTEQGQSPTDLLGTAMQTILDQNPGGHKAGVWPDSAESWITFRNTFAYDGVPINQWGLWALLRRQGMSEEAITMIEQAIGFMGPFQRLINAGESLQIIFDFPAPANVPAAAPPFFTARDGYQTLPLTLAKRVVELGGTIQLGEHILEVVVEGDDKLVRTASATYRAARVVLALPSEAMSRLAAASPALQGASFSEAARSVAPLELTKVGLFFDRRWWNKDPELVVTPPGGGAGVPIGILNGGSFSDLPAGSVYCFSQYPEDDEKDAAYTGPAALTIYTDFDRGSFWEEMQNLGEKYQTPEFPRNPPHTLPASTALVREAMKQLAAIFGLPPDAQLPMPVLSTYRVWGQGEFGHGYHQYRLNVDDRRVAEHIWRAAPGLFVCNEAWSPEQGWVEGSLIATDHVLVHGFGLAPFIPRSERA